MDLGYPGVPRAWRGEHLRTVRFERGPVAVIGDIHGRSDLLRALLARLGDMPIVVVGDVCDRGPDTRGVLDQLVAREAIGVLGNHDVWFAAWAAGEGFDRLALGIGGQATLASYGVKVEDAPLRGDAVPVAHRDWLLGLAVAMDLRVGDTTWWVAHAGIPSDEPLVGMTAAQVVPRFARERPDDLLWRLNEPESMLPLDRPIIMGHLPRRAPLDAGHVIALDTGSGGPLGRLTAVVLPQRLFVTVGGTSTC
jgi:serine/threonine protein phosphatase 1